MIETRDLVYKYKKLDDEGNVIGTSTALDHVNIHVKPGDFICILGHNGSGKSTFAKQLNALLLPTEGSATIGGMDTADENLTLPIRQAAGMVFQNPDNQIIASIVEEDVAFGPENIGVPTEEIRKRVEDSLRAVGMYDYRGYSPNKLSGGQKQRVAIAGVIAMEPKCIIMDESTAMLDPDGRAEVLGAVHRLNREKGITVIYITHYMEEVVDADYVFVMDHGKVYKEGKPREIFSQVEELGKIGLDVPQITRLAYELKKKGYDIPDGVLTRSELTEHIKRLCH